MQETLKRVKFWQILLAKEHDFVLNTIFLVLALCMKILLAELCCMNSLLHVTLFQYCKHFFMVLKVGEVDFSRYGKS